MSATAGEAKRSLIKIELLSLRALFMPSKAFSPNLIPLHE